MAPTLTRRRRRILRPRPAWSDVLRTLRNWPVGPELDCAVTWLDLHCDVPAPHRVNDAALLQRLRAGRPPSYTRLVRHLDLTQQCRRHRRQRRRRPPPWRPDAFGLALQHVGPLTAFTVDRVGLPRRLLAHLARLAQAHPGLRWLRIHRRPDLDPEALGWLMTQFPDLVDLDLRGSRVRALDLLQIPGLRPLRRIRIEGVTAEVLPLLQRASGLSALARIRFGPLSRLEGAAVDELARLPEPLHALWLQGEEAHSVLHDVALEAELGHLARATDPTRR